MPPALVRDYVKQVEGDLKGVVAFLGKEPWGTAYPQRKNPEADRAYPERERAFRISKKVVIFCRKGRRDAKERQEHSRRGKDVLRPKGRS